jgi:hypothetical protein
MACEAMRVKLQDILDRRGFKESIPEIVGDESSGGIRQFTPQTGFA